MALFERSPEGGSEEAPPAPTKGLDKREEIRDDEKEKEEEERRAALTYLIDTGRAKTPEEAEHYLDSLNRLKEKLLMFVREQLMDDTYAHKPIVMRYRGRAINKSDLDKMGLETIHRTDPRIWHLERDILPTSFLEYRTSRVRPLYRVKDTLAIPLGREAGGLVVIGSEEPGPYRLQAYLSGEDKKLLQQEYLFSLKDLELRLRLLADDIAAGKDIRNDRWEALMPPQEPEGKTT